MNQRRTLSKCVVGVVLGVLIAAPLMALLGGLAAHPLAHAQVPDSGAQRAAMIAELKLANQKLTELTALLKELRDRTPAPPKP